MQSKHIDGTWLLRLDPGEELLTELTGFCRRQGIECAHLSGIGAAGRLQVGVYLPARGCYQSQTFEGDFELTTLMGNITRKEGELFAHVHVNFAGSDLATHGGHVLQCVVSVTCEVVLRPLAASVQRTLDPALGLHTLHLG